MSSFISAVSFVLQNEGGFVEKENDSGGATNFGISLRFLKELSVEKLKQYGIFDTIIDVETIKNLTRSNAISIYRGEFWDAAPFGEIPDDVITCYLFDCCVLHGISEGVKLVQRASWALLIHNERLEDDGILGTQTLKFLLTYDISDVMHTLLACTMAERAGYMRLICAQNSKDKEFLNGWLERCYRL